jgi:5-amino-6-(5-phosphoribosylamino)uracil reductase
MIGMSVQVTVSYAQSLDGRIATGSGDSRYISGNASLRLAHKLRRENQAILVGINTVLRDDPRLTCRLVRGRSPMRLVLDSSLRLPPDSKLAASAITQPTRVFCAPQALESRERALAALGVKVARVPAGPAGLDLRAVLRLLEMEGCRRLLVEGGGQVITAFLRAGLVDRLVITTAPLLIGAGIAAIGELGVGELPEALRPLRVRRRRLGADLVWDLRLIKRAVP